MSNLVTNSAADKWVRQGINESALARKSFEATKVHAMNAGWNFMQARLVCDRDGSNFTDLLARHESQISQTAAYRYMQFVESALEWAAAEQPSLKAKPAELLKAAYKVVLQSPKPFIALMRQLGEMRKFGEYDAVKYAVNKRGTAQKEFSFVTMLGSLDLLTVPGEEECRFIFPEDRDEVEVIDEALTKARAIVARLEQIKQNKRVIEA